MWVNDYFTTITGYQLGDVIGQKPSILQGPGSEPEVIARIRRGLDEETPFQEQITNYRKNGEEYRCKLVIHPIFSKDRNLTNFIAFEVDVESVPDHEEYPILQLHQKYSTSSLKGFEEMKLFARLQAYMERDRPFLDPDLTLKQVSDHLATNTKYLSQVVNHQAGVNFQQFINRYRVQEVQQKILDPASSILTLFGIALQCGFKNKSTFYKVFKEITGQTPRDYLKQHDRKPSA